MLCQEGFIPQLNLKVLNFASTHLIEEAKKEQGMSDVDVQIPHAKEQAPAQATTLVQATIETFDDVVIAASKQRPVMVDFWASWCAPCQAQLPILQTLAKQMQGQLDVVKVNTEEQLALPERFQVRSLPTLMLFYRGEVVQQLQGLQGESALRQWVEPYVVHEYDQLLQRGEQCLSEGRVDEGIELLRQAWQQVREQQISRPEFLARLATALMENNRLAEAQQALEQADLLLQRAPEIVQAKSRLALFQSEHQSDGDVVSQALALAAEQNFDAALEQLLARLAEPSLAVTDKDRARKAVVDILNTMPDREQANAYRRRLFSLLH